MKRERKPIDSPKDIPAGLSDEERMLFLEEHGVSEHFLESVEEVPEDERPKPRTKPINIRFDDYTLARLKRIAEQRNVGYQTLLKDFVIERLYEEERREGVFSVGGTSGNAPTREATDLTEGQQGKSKASDWQSWAYEFVKENEELLEDEDVDSITLSRLAKNVSSPLVTLSQEIRRASNKEGFPAARLRRMRRGYDKLKDFTERVLNLYEAKFGPTEESLEGEKKGDEETESAYSAVKEAEKIVAQGLRP